jgi:hypothetical protein
LPPENGFPSIEELFMRPHIRRVVISRSGRYLATINENSGQERILIKDLVEGTEKSVSPAENNDLGNYLSFAGTETKLFYNQTYKNSRSELVMYDVETGNFVIDRIQRASLGIIQSVEKALFDNIVYPWDSNPSFVVSEKKRASLTQTFHKSPQAGR